MDYSTDKFMNAAIEMAKEAFDDGEVPVGAVIVRDGEIIAKGRNRREKSKNALLHAEVDAINNACKALGGWRLWNCEIYITLEPCPMCAGAIINAHIPKVYFALTTLRTAHAEQSQIFLKCRTTSSPSITAELLKKNVQNF